MLQLSDYDLTSLSYFPKCSENFDCGNKDLNEFLIDDALNYQKELIIKTYIWFDKNKSIVAYASISNDLLNIRGILNIKSEYDNFNYYPAVKIARLGVNTKFKRNNLGTQILTFLKIFMIAKNKTGCRLLLVDALNNKEALEFYDKNEFKFLDDYDYKHGTRIMYFDLYKYYNSITQIFPNFFKEAESDFSKISY